MKLCSEDGFPRFSPGFSRASCLETGTRHNRIGETKALDLAHLDLSDMELLAAWHHVAVEVAVVFGGLFSKLQFYAVLICRTIL